MDQESILEVECNLESTFCRCHCGPICRPMFTTLLSNCLGNSYGNICIISYFIFTIVIMKGTTISGGTWNLNCLRHCATGPKVVGSILDEVVGIFLYI